MRGRIARGLWHLWVSFCMALLVLVLLEGAARLAVSTYRERVAAGDVLAFEGALRNGVTGPHWASEYIQEFVAVQTRWHPYVYWRVAPQRGKHINVDQAGIRRTWNASATPAPGHQKIFMIGGSGMWGAGARDEFTIPSFVAKQLAADGRSKAWVTNHAQVGWVSTQGVLSLTLELRKNNIPDVVIFSDGINDMWAAFQNGVPGLTINEDNRIREFNLTADGDLRPTLVRRLALFTVTDRVLTRIAGPRRAGRPGEDPAKTDQLAQGVVDAYLWNVQHVEALGARYGFKTLFFWQPTLFTKRVLSDDEREEMRALKNARAVDYVRQTNKVLNGRLQTGKYPNVHNLEHVFGDTPQTMFLDSMHPLEPGNERIATVMVEILRRSAIPLTK